MKRLRVVFVMLLALAMSIGMFACSDGGKTDESGARIRTLYESGSQTVLELTDSDSKADYETARDALKLVWNTDQQGFRYNYTGADHTFTGEDAITFGTVGTFTVKATPKQNNAGNVSANITVIISHDFEDLGNGVLQCKHDGVRQTTSAEDVTVHYGSFHTAFTGLPSEVGETYYTNEKADSKISEFGTVTVNGVEETVPTLTAGRLEPGMTITVRGTAKTTGAAWGLDAADLKAYFYPVIGIADRYNNSANPAHEGYTGGTAVFVRGEGWVLYNGLGNAADGTRMLAGLVGSDDTADRDYPNYGSHETASDTDNNPPTGWVKGQMPDPASADWHDWWVYSTGASYWANDLASETPVELSWYYRNDGIIELTYRYNYTSSIADAITTSKIYIKVPEATRGYYETVLHGDYTDLTVSQVVITEENTTKAFRIEEVTGDGIYYEGQRFNAETIVASVQFEQTGEVWNRISVSEGDVYATTDETVTENSVWVNLGDHPLLDSAYKHFKVELVKSGKTFTQSIPDDKITVVPNAIARAYGSNATVGGVTFANNKKLGEFDLSATAAGEVKLTLQSGAAGVAQALSAEQKAEFGAQLDSAKTYKYVAFRLDGQEVNTSFNDTCTANVPYLYEKDGSVIYLVLALDSAQSVTLTGLQTTTVVIDLSTVTGFAVSSAVTGDAGKINQDTSATGSATIVYTLKEGVTPSSVAFDVAGNMLGTAYLAGASLPARIGTTDVYVTKYAQSGATISLTLGFSPLDVVDLTGDKLYYTVSALVSGATETTDVIARNLDGFTPIEELEQNAKQITTADGYLVRVYGDYIYLMKAVKSADVKTENLGESNLVLNLNAGGSVDDINLLDLGFKATKSGVSFLRESAGTATANLIVAGTADDAADEDDGAVILIRINVTELGLASRSAYGFEVNPDGSVAPTYYYWSTQAAAQAFTRKIEKIPFSGTEREVIEEGTCFKGGMTAYVARNDNDEVVFYLGLTEIGGAHVWGDDDICDLCGAVRETAVRVTEAEDSARITVRDGQYVSITGKYGDAMMKQAFNGIEARIILDNGTWVRFRNDGYYALETNNGGATLAYNSNEFNTINGVLNLIDGRPIDATEGDALTSSVGLSNAKAGATFTVRVSLVDGLVTVYFELIRAGEDTPWTTTTMKVSVPGTTSLTVGFRLDTYNANGTATIVGGTVERTLGRYAGNDVSSVTTDAITTDKGTVAAATNVSYDTNGIYVFRSEQIEEADVVYAKIAASGVPEKMTAAVKTALGIPADNTSYTHYVAFTLNLNSALPLPSTVTVKTLAGERAEYVYAKIVADGTKVDFVVPVDGTVTKYLVDFVNLTASTIQSDFVLDLSELAVSDIGGEVQSNVTIFGGRATVVYTGTVPADGKFSVNGVSVAWSSLNGYDFGNGVTASVEGQTVTLTVAAHDLTKAIPAYKIELRSAEDVLLALNSFDALTLPEQNLIQDYYVKATDGKLALVTAVSSLTSAGSHTLSINANGGAGTVTAETYAERLANYNLSYTVARGAATFDNSNLLTRASTVVYSASGDRAVVAIVLDLEKLGIGATTAYAFEFAESYCAVAADRTLTAFDPGTSGSPVVLQAVDCEKDGYSAYEYRAEADGPVTFYYGVQVEKGGHIFAEDANVGTGYLEGVNYYSGVCLREGCDANASEEGAQAATGWKVEGIQVGSTDNSVKWMGGAAAGHNPHGNNLAYNPASGARYSVIKQGQVITATGVTTSKMSGNWSGFAALLYRGAEFVDGTHLRVDNWINGIGGQNGSITDQGLTYAATTNVTDWEAMKNAVANGYATVVWDWSSESEIIVTIHVIGLSNGYEFTQLYTVTPLAGNEFEREYSIGLAPDEGSFYGDIVCVGPAGDVDPNPSKKDASGEIVVPTDPTYSNNQNPTAENPIVVGNSEHNLSFTNTTPVWIGKPVYIGQKVEMTGTLESNATQTWQTVILNLTSGVSFATGTAARMDNWLIATESGFNAVMSGAITDANLPENYLSVLSDCNVTLTFDWTSLTACIFSMTISDKTDAATSWTVSVTLTPGQASGWTTDHLNLGIGGEQIWLRITNVERTGAVHEHSYDSVTDECVCGNVNPNHEHNFVNGVCTAGDARQVTTTESGTNYTGVLTQVAGFVNNDTDWSWWNGSTSDVALSGNFVVVFEWDNVNDPEFALDAVLELNDGTPTFLDVDVMNTAGNAWGGLVEGKETSHNATGEGVGGSAWGGHYVCTVTRVGTTITIVTTFTPAGGSAVTVTNTYVLTSMTTDDLVGRINGNPAPLSNFAAWYGSLTVVE